MDLKTSCDLSDYSVAQIGSFDALRNTGLPCVIFGAGIMGEALHYMCEKYGIPVQFLCDNNAAKIGQTVRGTPVISVEQATTLPKEVMYLISVADIQDVVPQLLRHGQTRWIAGGILLQNETLPANAFSAADDFVRFALDACISCHHAYLHPDGLFLRSVDIVITERCSLKCRDCSNLMQYYARPVNRSLDEIMRSIDGLCAVADEVNEVRLIGGEPFMNKDIYPIMQRLLEEPRVHRIVIFTNGSVVPPVHWDTLLRDPKLFFVITDYGGLVKNTELFVSRLREIGAAYYVQPPNNWTACSSIEPHGRSGEAQAQLFSRCCAKYLFTMLDGKFYRCPFVAHVDNLGATPQYAEDSVLLSDWDGSEEKRKTLREMMRQYIGKISFLQSCDFCAGRFLDDPKIEPALQVAQPITFRSYR
jgi:hypothetical protein